MEERLVEVGDGVIYSREAGEGPPILFLHGFPQTGHCWRGMVDRLSDRFRLLMPDVPGFGRSTAPHSHDVGTVADLMWEYLDALEAPNSTVVAHDWGGAFAFRMALDHPERMSKLVVTNTAFRELSPLHSWYIGVINIPVLPELAFGLAGDRILAWALRGASRDGRSVFDGEPLKVYQEAYADPERIRSAFAYYRTVTRKAVGKQLRAHLGRGVVETEAVSGGRERRIEMPTLIVWGMRDPALPPKLLDGMKRDIPQAEVVKLDCGHFVPEERPDELARAIRSFI